MPKCRPLNPALLHAATVCWLGTMSVGLAGCAKDQVGTRDSEAADAQASASMSGVGSGTGAPSVVEATGSTGEAANPSLASAGQTDTAPGAVTTTPDTAAAATSVLGPATETRETPSASSAPSSVNDASTFSSTSSRDPVSGGVSVDASANEDATSLGPVVDGGSVASEGEFGVPGIIAVGYGGLRVVSRDLGETWEDEIHWSSNGGDDRDLLRTIAYGNGLWVSGGWKITTSTDGVSWTDRGDAADVISDINCQVTDGMAFGNAQFLVACGSTMAASSDGLDWRRVGQTPRVGNHPYLVFDASTEQFGCSGDDGASFVSDDGQQWTSVDLQSLRLCAGGFSSESECKSFYSGGVYLSSEWGGSIRRSDTGDAWQERYSDQHGNNTFTSFSFAAGRVAP